MHIHTKVVVDIKSNFGIFEDALPCKVILACQCCPHFINLYAYSHVYWVLVNIIIVLFNGFLLVIICNYA